MGFRFKHGKPLMIDLIAPADLTAGDTIIVSGKACIVHSDYSSGDKAAVAWPSGSAVYAIEEDYTFTSSEDTLAAGDTLYVETGQNGNLSDTSTSNFAVGSVLSAIADSASADGVLLVHGG